MTAPFIPPANPVIGDEEIRAVSDVMRTGMIAQGPEVTSFENEFSEFVDGSECIGVNSGTSALHLGLLAAGVGPGDEVIVPSFTFAATANSVAATGATPVFVDIQPETFAIDPDAVAAAITGRTKGIMPVHLYGQAANLTELAALSDKYGILMFEDAAQAHAASFDGRPVGSWGTFGAFSFYPTKNMTSGEGGMVTTRDPGLARKVRLLRNQGMETRYENEVVGFNNRMTDLHAAIGRVQLTHLREWTNKRQANAAFFDRNLQGVITPAVVNGATHVYHQYTVRVVDADRDEFAVALKNEHKIGSGVYYPVPNHRLPSLERYASGVELPETERAAKEVLSLPVYPSLTDEQLERIVNAVNAVAKAGA